VRGLISTTFEIYFINACYTFKCGSPLLATISRRH